MLRIEPYKIASKGAKALATRTGILRATPKQVRQHGDFDLLLNWGSSERRFNGEYINNPEAVAVASNKLQSARRFGESHIPQPDYTTDREVAEGWLRAGTDVCERTHLRGSGGKGLSVITGAGVATDGTGCTNEPDMDVRRGCIRRTLVDAPLYTKYVKKATEYRVHVFDGEVIDVQQKRKRQEVPNEEVNYQIRNACNGWVFCRGGVDAPASVLSAAIRAVSVLSLDFGAVDVGWNNHTQTPCVYEVNTAPGVEGSTLDKYFRALEQRIPALRMGAYARRRNR
jgi:hypothetical protein